MLARFCECTEVMVELRELKDWAAIVGVIIALLTLMKGVYEYTRQNAQKRAEYFLDMRKRLNEESIREICALLEKDDDRLRDLEFKDKRYFLGLFEEIALMMNSGLVRREVVHYMFGYYAIKSWESDKFWRGLRREDPYWALFSKFADEMKGIERTFKFRLRKFRF